LQPEPDAEDNLKKSTIHFAANIQDSYISGSKKSTIEPDSATPVRDEGKSLLPKEKGALNFLSKLRLSFQEKMMESEDKLRRTLSKQDSLDLEDAIIIEQQLKIEEDISKER
jgi:hypothetical protein